jgi:hypothetical protein
LIGMRSLAKALDQKDEDMEEDHFVQDLAEYACIPSAGYGDPLQGRVRNRKFRKAGERTIPLAIYQHGGFELREISALLASYQGSFSSDKIHRRRARPMSSRDGESLYRWTEIERLLYHMYMEGKTIDTYGKLMAVGDYKNGYETNIKSRISTWRRDLDIRNSAETNGVSR